VDLREVFPDADRRYVARVSALDDQAAVDALGHLLRERNPRPDRNIAKINRIIAAIESDEALRTVAAVAAAFLKSERWMQQFFRDYVGLGLKWLLQRHRLLAAAERIRASARPDWSAIAYELGYSSQQHFNTDFKAVLGRTPSGYKRWTG
jgi:AraC-like DNA-binding protein